MALTARQRRQYDAYLESVGALNYQTGGGAFGNTGTPAVPDWILNPPERPRPEAAAAPVAATNPTPAIPVTTPRTTPTAPTTPAPSVPAFDDVIPSARVLMPFMADLDRTNISSYYNIEDQAGGGARPARDRRYFMSAGRAQQAISALDSLNPGEKGPGYNFLVNALGLLQQYGSAEGDGMTRANQVKLNEGLQALLSGYSDVSTLAPFRQLASMFLAPRMNAAPQRQATRSRRLFI